MKNRLGLTFLATGALLLAAVSACADNDRRSSADDASHIVSNRIEGTDGHRLDDVADRRRDR